MSDEALRYEALAELDGRSVLLGVTGGIAAYKSAELCRLLVRSGASVQVLMTRAAQEFVGAATFAALSARPVATALFDPQQEAQIGHIRAADEAELFVVAPATANALAQFAHGLASDLLSTSYLAYGGPVVLAPAMNVRMWEHPATQDNVALLRRRDAILVGPEAGELACGHVGAGRMAKPSAILEACVAALSPQALRGKKVVISAGPTREAIDSVRFISNRSTGKMGFALAVEAVAQGAEVTLVAGPSALAQPWGVRLLRVSSAAEMAETVFHCAEGADAVIMAAAVADYRPQAVVDGKLKKASWGDAPNIALERTTDILLALGRGRASGDRRPILVGFGAETASGTELERLAETKRAQKGCDLLVANDISRGDAGFGAETNQVLIVAAGRPSQYVALASKRSVARAILARVAELWTASDE